MNVLLYSSGMDSYIGYYYLKIVKKVENVIPVYVDLGHRYSKIEQWYVRKYRPNTLVLNFPNFGKIFEEYDALIPNRNLLLALLVSSYFYNYNVNSPIYFGGLKDDRIEDNNPEAFKRFSEALYCSSNNPKAHPVIKSVFDFKLTKKEIVDWYMDNAYYIDYISLNQATFSCYTPNETRRDPHCNSCRACFRRNVALFDYEKIRFEDLELLNQYYKELKQNKDQYDKIRYEQSEKYCKWSLGI